MEMPGAKKSYKVEHGEEKFHLGVLVAAKNLVDSRAWNGLNVKGEMFYGLAGPAPEAPKTAGACAADTFEAVEVTLSKWNGSEVTDGGKMMLPKLALPMMDHGEYRYLFRCMKDQKENEGKL